jgi:hypothetical protein
VLLPEAISNGGVDKRAPCPRWESSCAAGSLHGVRNRVTSRNERVAREERDDLTRLIAK